jgi:hypothetical protein
MSDNGRHGKAQWVLYVVLFVVTAWLAFMGFSLLVVLTTFAGWVIAPAKFILGGVFFVYLALIFGLFFLARRKGWAWLKAIVYGGGSVPAVAFIMLLPGPRGSRTQKPNQREPLASPSGRFVLTVPIERSKRDRGPLGFGFPYWHVTIADPNGQVLYREPEECFHGIHSVYWVWDDKDRVWLYNSDDGAVYVYEQMNGK